MSFVYKLEQIIWNTLFTNVKYGLFTFVNMKESINLWSFLKEYEKFKNQDLSGRYLSFNELKPQLEKLNRSYNIKEIGRSFLNVPIYSIKIGSGPVKVLGWSQMHGNESTTTKAVFDLMNLFSQKNTDHDVKNILEKCTFLVIPMLNPDGAARYIRENVNKVDLNRDAHDLKELESKVLRACYEDFQPDFCFNLHDQRTIFSAGDTNKPATLSFLSPSMDKKRTITEVRLKAMQVIAAMNKALQSHIPGQIGRYDDAFNINCTGDTFQSLKVPTILFEAGHYPGDYMREETRKYMAFAIFVALKALTDGSFEDFIAKDYIDIPENRKNFFDVILRNASVEGELVDIALQFEEKVKGRVIHFVPVVQTMAENLSNFGHREIDCESLEVRLDTGKIINENDIVSEIMLNGEQLSIKSQDIP